MPPKPTKHIQPRHGDNVRIGPISIITLITVISLSVLAVLAVSTSTATETIAKRQAVGVQYLYANERAGQEFVAGVDEALASIRSLGGSAQAGARAVEGSLDGICENARAAADGVTCTASVDGTTVTAEFVCENARRLNVALAIGPDATYRITQWKMAAAQQKPDSGGALWSGNG